MKKLIIMMAAGFIFVATPVMAEHHGDKKGKMFETKDTNGDGQISEAEFLEHAKKKFAEKDKNSDGVITKEEAAENKKERREKMKEMKEKWKEKRSEKMKEKSTE